MVHILGESDDPGRHMISCSSERRKGGHEVSLTPSSSHPRMEYRWFSEVCRGDKLRVDSWTGQVLEVMDGHHRASHAVFALRLPDRLRRSAGLVRAPSRMAAGLAHRDPSDCAAESIADMSAQVTATSTAKWTAADHHSSGSYNGLRYRAAF